MQPGAEGWDVAFGVFEGAGEADPATNLVVRKREGHVDEQKDEAGKAAVAKDSREPEPPGRERDAEDGERESVCHTSAGPEWID